MDEIGSTLREARMRERIDISEVEASTKIRAKYLRAIENEEWDLLPGPIYAKSFLRTYGDYLGLDSRMLLDEFKRRYEHPSEHDVRPIASVAARDRTRRERDRRPPGRRVPPWAPILFVVVVIVVVLYVVGSLGSSTTQTNTVARKPAATHSTRRVIPKPSTPTAVPLSSATLQLVPTNAVYVCLVNGQGAKLINERTFAVGQTIPSERAPTLLLTLGNANVQMKVNGKVIQVAPSATAIRLLITPTRIQHIPLSHAPTCP
jgi:cytoskeletal protein RodZ